MVSAGNQGLGLSDRLGEELLRHLKVEMCDVAMGMSPGTAAPIHTNTLLALMFELLPYDNSDKSEFSEERFHNFLSELNDEIIEEEKRRKKPPEPESANHILLANLFLACGRVRVLERSTVDTALKAAAVALGLDPADHATHSLRAGGATALYAIGSQWPPSKIQRRGRWLSDCWLLYIWPDREEAAGPMEDVVSSPAPLFHI